MNVLPLLDVIGAVPERNNAAWLLRCQITALPETFRRVLEAHTPKQFLIVRQSAGLFPIS